MEQKIKFFRKTVFVSFILLVQAAFIYAYYTQESFLKNFKWEYVQQVYLPAYLYELENNNFLQQSESISHSRAAGPGQRAIPVLLYHGVVEREDGSNILVDNFREQMTALKKAGYQTVKLTDFSEFVQGKKELPEKSILLTFDDGRKDSYYPADPILKALNYNAVMYLITRYINAENDNFYLSRQELQKMLDSGRWELEAHTKEGHDFVTIGPNEQKGHYYSNKIWDPNLGPESDRQYRERVFNDLIEAQNDLENSFGLKVTSLAFPFGDYGQNSLNYPPSKDILLDIIHYAYPIAFYQITIGNGYMFNYAGENDYLFKRINISPEWTGDDLLSLLEKGQPKDLPFEDNFTGQKGWFGSSVRNELTKNGLRLRPPTDSQSGTLFLEGSKHWKDYTYTSSINWAAGNKLSLLARHKDNSNYLSCEISGQYLQLVSEFGGENQLLSEVQIPGTLEKNNLKVVLNVAGDKLSCVVNDLYRVEFSGIRNEQSYGGVGVRTSDNVPGNGEIILKQVTVSEPNAGQPNSAEGGQKDNTPVGTQNNLFYNKLYAIFK